MTRIASRPDANEAAADPLTARFAAALERLCPEPGRIGLAVSGGPDSLALLLLAERAIPGRFEVATVDHRLRAGSGAECAMVADVCADRGVACTILPVTVQAGNTQAAARAARYAALAGWAERETLAAIATAHHADDQAETLLMRLNRASGLSGLAGIRESASIPDSGVRLIRPLLAFRRSELARVVERAGLVPVQDPSNTDERFDRVRIRKALGDCDWLDPLALAAAAAHLGEAEEAVEYAIGRACEDRVAGNAYRFDPPVPRTIELAIVDRLIRSLGGEPRGQDIARLVDRLHDGKGGNLAGVLVTVEADMWTFRPEPPRRV
jgi:tRNA(Ile)-lysidine synthase